MKKIILLCFCSYFVFAKSYFYEDKNEKIFFNDSSVFSVVKKIHIDEDIAIKNSFQFFFQDKYNILMNIKKSFKINKYKKLSKKLDFDIQEKQVSKKFYYNYTKNHKYLDFYYECNEGDICERASILVDYKQNYYSFCNSSYNYYNGAAHGVKDLDCSSYKDNQKLQLQDLFDDYQAFSNLVIKKINDSFYDSTLISNEAYNISESSFISQNYFLIDDYLVLLYNPYVIQPYFKGLIAIIIKKDYIKNYLKKEYLN